MTLGETMQVVLDRGIKSHEPKRQDPCHEWDGYVPSGRLIDRGRTIPSGCQLSFAGLAARVEVSMGEVNEIIHFKDRILIDARGLNKLR